MSYIRGDTYVFRSSTGIHIWAADGYDYWDGTIWYCDAPPEGTSLQDRDRGQAEERASGVRISEEVFDDLAVMRFAELVKEGKAAGAMDHAIAAYMGNMGCQALGELREVLEERLDID